MPSSDETSRTYLEVANEQRTVAPQSGTVTFLFTDIEGSTRLRDDHPEAMCQALGRHDTILADAVESSGGHVVKTTGLLAPTWKALPGKSVGRAVAVPRAEVDALSWLTQTVSAGRPFLDWRHRLVNHAR